MNSQRILLIGGLLLFLAGITYGLYFHLMVNMANQHSLLYNIDMALNMAVKGDFETASAFAEQYRAESAAQEIQRRIPFELITTGLLSAPLIIASRYIEASEKQQRVFSLLVVLGGFILASGDIITVYGPEQWGYLITLGGYSWIFFGLLGYIVYTALYMWMYDTSKTGRSRHSQNSYDK